MCKIDWLTHEKKAKAFQVQMVYCGDDCFGLWKKNSQNSWVKTVKTVLATRELDNIHKCNNNTECNSGEHCNPRLTSGQTHFYLKIRLNHCFYSVKFWIHLRNHSPHFVACPFHLGTIDICASLVAVFATWK